MPSAQGRPSHGSARQPSGPSGQSGKESGLLSLLDVQASRRRQPETTPARAVPDAGTAGPPGQIMAFGPGERDGFAVGQNDHQEATLEIPPVLVQVIHEVYQFFEVGRGGSEYV